jgi:hypothetical protein
MDKQPKLRKMGQKLAVSRKTTLRFHMEKFNHKKLNDGEGKGQYRVEISNMFKLWKT